MCSILNTYGQNKIIYSYEIHQEITPSVSRLTKSAIEEAEKRNAAYLLIDMDTYGGLVDAADEIRTMLLKTKIPTIVFVRNNAASAGALISIACDSIYMSPGSTIGAASVVNQAGELMPEKYQSYMRKKMRATAEETGRNPLIAEGMSDENLVIDSIKEKGKIITLSVKEAMRYGYCNGEVSDPEQIISKLKGGPYIIEKHESSMAESIILWLVNPAVSGVLLLIIFGGIYFEFKAPGTFIPIAVSAMGAMLYFAPLYLEGLAANWEIIVFVAGVALIIVEIFVLPGFGVAGISGILLTVAALTLAMVRNIDFDFSLVPGASLATAFLTVTLAMAAPLVLLLLFGHQIFNSGLFRRMADVAEMKTADGYSIKDNALQKLVGNRGVSVTDLRPAGKIEIDGERYDSISDGDFIAKGTGIKVIRVQASYLIVDHA
ncbi:MAG: nodulation protein NfeD [Bacteroidetes bacterium]|nr:nodulation protein NfeD [Bacteroidota bacterium]